MAKRSRRRLWASAAGLAALTAAGATPAAAAPSAVSGTFTTLAGGTERGLSLDGVAVLVRTPSSTRGVVVVRGLEPGVLYAAHLHNQPCSFRGNPGGGHYAQVPGAGTTPPNELWFSSTADPIAGLQANPGGIGVGRGSASWEARPEAQSVVIHAIPPGGSPAGGPKIACADLS